MQNWFWSKLIQLWMCIASMLSFSSPYDKSISKTKLHESIQYYLRGYLQDDPNGLRTFDILMGYDTPSRDMNDYFLSGHRFGNDTFEEKLCQFENGWLTNATLLSFENRINPRTGKKILFDKIDLKRYPSIAKANISWELVRELVTDSRDELPWARMKHRFDRVELSFPSRRIDSLPDTKYLEEIYKMSSVETIVRDVKHFCKNGVKQLDLLYFDEKSLNDLSYAIKQHCHNLTDLSIITRGFSPLIEVFPRKAQLQSLEINTWTPKYVHAMTEFKNLRKLSAYDSLSEMRESRLAFSQILQKLPNLEILKLNSLNPDLLMIAFQHDYLKELHLKSYCYIDFGVQTQNYKLEHLELDFKSKTFLSNCNGLFPNLKYLLVGEIPLKASCLREMPNLKTLVVKKTRLVLKGRRNRSVEKMEVSTSALIKNNTLISELSRLFVQFSKLKVIKYHELRRCSYQELKTQLEGYRYSLVNWGSYYSAKIYRPPRTMLIPRYV